jgi:hypothetical protein
MPSATHKYERVPSNNADGVSILIERNTNLSLYSNYLTFAIILKQSNEVQNMF